MKTLFQILREKNKERIAKTFLFSIIFSLVSLTNFAQEKVKDSTKVNQLDEVLVSAIRVTTKTPVTFSNIDNRELKNRNLGQDIPILLNFMPSVVTTSDAGNGVGYTGIRVRGSDATRVNVTINGIPYNDAEASGTYFVDLPDFASSVESLQLQRGVGTSTNGAGAFGASLNMLTDSYSKQSFAELSNSGGSFATRKSTVKFSSGLLNDRFEMTGRLSNISSQGYIDRASSDLKSYFLQGTFVGKSSIIKALVFGGTEKTYQAWNGIDAAMLANDRTFNYSGMFTDELGNTRFYSNETDNYQQDHYQLHWNEKINTSWRATVALHYTKGKGYYENYKEDAAFEDYGLFPVAGEVSTDLIRQKWLDNDFYGTTFSVNYKKSKWDILVGGSWNKYEGKHFGKVIWARFASTSELGDHYYDDFGIKTDGTVFAKANYQVTQKLSFYGDLQYRQVNYKANGVQADMVNDTFGFINPKAGVNFDLSPKNRLYFSYAKANREPNRTDYENGNPKSERLDDFELGWRHKANKFQWTANMYYMLYENQLILTGELDEVGNPIRANTDKSYRLGAEIEAVYLLTKQLTLQMSITTSSNVIKDGSKQKQIAYSPSLIGSSIISYEPFQNFKLIWLQKHVGQQYLDNSESTASRLPSYSVNDLNIAYEVRPKSIFKAIAFTGLINNFMDKNYISNGYMYGVDPYYFPQAGINFLLGMTLKF
jgi:iron complex outermembrane receptor protein